MKVERQCDQFCRDTKWFYSMTEDQCLPGHQRSMFHSSFQAHVTIEITVHRLGAWIGLNKKRTTTLASVQHQDQCTGRSAAWSPPRQSTRAAPTNRTSSLPRYRHLTLHAALEQSRINQHSSVQDPVLAAALQLLEAQDKTSTSASRTSTNTDSSYHSSSNESSKDDDSSDGQVRYGELDCSHRNSRPKQGQDETVSP
jgi:hypothetical protein